MSHTPQVTDVESWHRYFAIVCNNLAWDFSTQDRDPAQDLAMLNAAHASAFHWEATGTELNYMRAKMLLAQVHALVGLGALAFALANEILSYFTTNDAPDWEIALAHTIHAHAASAASESDAHRDSYSNAVEAIKMIVSEDDRNIVRESFDLVPAP